MVRGWLLIGVLATIVVLAVFGLTDAQDTATAQRQPTGTAPSGATAGATLPPPITPTPQVPDPTECDVPPREPPLFPEPAAPAPSPTPFALPEGERVERETVRAITATVRTSIACRNAGDFLRSYALFSDRYLESFLGGDEGMTAVLDLLLTTPTPIPADERLGLVNVSEVRRLTDGRVGAVVVTQDAGRGYADYLYFVEVGGRWLIDERVFLSETDADRPPELRPTGTATGRVP